jgi:hypothetical protein
MALLLRDTIDAGAPPSLAKLPMTPEEVAASYAGDDGFGGLLPAGPGDTKTNDLAGPPAR